MVSSSALKWAEKDNDIAHASNSPTTASTVSSTAKSGQISSEEEFNFRKMTSLRFVMQVVITVFMLGLCWGGLQAKDEATRALYWGGITGIIGWWMPSPGGSRDASSNSQKP